jgi:hypothetical protein
MGWLSAVVAAATVLFYQISLNITSLPSHLARKEEEQLVFQ